MKTLSLRGAVKFFGEMSGGMERVRHAALEEAAEVIEARAKALIGHQQPNWPPLKPETITRKSAGMPDGKSLHGAGAASNSRTGLA